METTVIDNFFTYPTFADLARRKHLFPVNLLDNPEGIYEPIFEFKDWIPFEFKSPFRYEVSYSSSRTGRFTLATPNVSDEPKSRQKWDNDRRPGDPRNAPYGTTLTDALKTFVKSWFDDATFMKSGEESKAAIASIKYLKEIGNSLTEWQDMTEPELWVLAARRVYEYANDLKAGYADQLLSMKF